MRKRLVTALAIATAAFAGVAGQAIAATATHPAAGHAATAPSSPTQDPFYSYTGSTPLSQIALGTVLKTRTFSFTPAIGGPLELFSGVQLLYRSENALGQPTVNVASVLKPLVSTGNVVSYGSFYDSLSPVDDPSWQFYTDSTSGSEAQDDQAMMLPYLLAGDTVVVADTEGENPDFAAGPEYGYNTLNALRAAFNASSSTGIATDAKVALVGYSGGAIAAGWASELAPTYAPTINSRIVGTAMGGVFVDPLHNLSYVSGSDQWAGVMAEALIGLARAYDIDLTPYLSSYGSQIVSSMQNDNIDEFESALPNLTWAQLVKPQYDNPASILPLVQTSNRLIMGSNGTPSKSDPFYILQGAGGTGDGTPAGGPGIGPGDGVMVLGDVEALANEYCKDGVPVDFNEVADATHEQGGVLFVADAPVWVTARFLGTTAPSSCGQIPAGNDISPAPLPSGGSSGSGGSGSGGSGSSGSGGSGSPHAGRPHLSNGRYSGLKTGKVSASATVTSASNAPALRQLSIQLASGLHFHGDKVHGKLTVKGVTVKHAKIKSLALKHGRLVIVLAQPVRSLTVKLAPAALTESAYLIWRAQHSNVKADRIKSLRLDVTVTDAAGKRTVLREPVKRI